jgi:WD40 repeat protein
MDLQRHVNNEPVIARPASQLYRFHKLVRRNRLGFAASTAVIAALVFGTVGSTWQASRATKASKEAVASAQKATQAQAKESAARADAEQILYGSLAREARATRMARRPGYRERVFELLRRAGTLRRDTTDPAELRCEASQCLGDFVGLNSTVLRDFPANIEVSSLDQRRRLAAFGLENSTVVLCRVPSGEIVARLSVEPAGRYGSPSAAGFQSLCFSPDSDQLLSIQGSNRVCRWMQSADGQWSEAGEKTTVPGVFAGVSSAKDLFLAVNDVSAHQIKLLDPATKTPVRAVEYLQEINASLTVALSSDSRFLAIGGDSASNGLVTQIWDLPSGNSSVRREPRLAELCSLNFSDDAEYLSCLSGAGGRIYTRREGWQAVAEVRGPFEFSGLRRIVFAPEGTVVAWPLSCKVVQIKDWTRNGDLAVLKEARTADQLAFVAGGQFLLTSGGRQASLYQLNTPEKLTLAGHAGGVPGLAFSPKNANVASVGKDQTVKVWDLTTRRVVWAAELPGKGQTVAYSPDGNLLAAGVRALKPVLLWDAQTGRQLSQLETGPGGVWSVQFSSDGRYLAAAGEPYGVKVWALKPHTLGVPEPWAEPTLVRSFPGRCGGLVFSMDSSRLAFTDKKPDHHEVDIWDLDTGTPPHAIATNHSFNHQGLAFTPDGRYLLNTDTDRAVVTLDLGIDKEVSRFMTEELSPEDLLDATRQREWSGVIAFRLSPDGTKLAVSPVSSDGVDIWDPKTGRRLYSLPEDNGSIWWLDWSTDSSKLAVSRSTGDISVWKLPEIERILAGLGLKP